MGSYEADARLPDLDREPGFIKTQEEPWQKSAGVHYRYVAYKRIKE